MGSISSEKRGQEKASVWKVNPDVEMAFPECGQKKQIGHRQVPGGSFTRQPRAQCCRSGQNSLEVKITAGVLR